MSSRTMLACPVCKLDYTNQGDQQPRLLVTCGHTFCQKCLDSQSDSEPLSCPQCSIVSVDPHVANITIMNYVAAQMVSTNPPAPVHSVPAPVKAICQDCKREIATLICFQCLPAGFRFCNACSTREHSRSFGPVREHNPKPIASVKISTPVPLCKTHPERPCLFFSFKMNAFACEQCKDIRNFIEEDFVTIEEAVTQIREKVPSLVALLRERVTLMSNTRADLEKLLGKLDQEKKRSLERVSVEFSQIEMALKKRMGELMDKIEEEAKYQSKELLQQQERLEIAQGNADTAIVRANWLLQMSDYTYMHQAEAVINSMKSQLADEEVPMYHSACTTGEIPMFLPEEFLASIDKLGTVGGGRMPTRLKCFVRGGLLYVSWEQSDPEVKETEVSYEPFDEESADPTADITSGYERAPPRSIIRKGSKTEAQIDDIVVGMKYMFRVRALNAAGWGVWGNPVIGKLDSFPLEVKYTGKIVHIELPQSGCYSIMAYGAKAADGDTKKGGKGAIIGAKFILKKNDRLIILCGGMSTKVGTSTGGAGGTFVALNRQRDILLVAGGGGGTRGYDEEDLDGTDASLSESGADGIGAQWAQGGAGGGAGKDANFSGPSWGYGGAGFSTASSTAKSFLHGGTCNGEGGGFGGGGSVGQYGGGGGGGYSGGGGGRGGGGGGSYIKPDESIDPVKELGHEDHGMVTVDYIGGAA